MSKTKMLVSMWTILAGMAITAAAQTGSGVPQFPPPENNRNGTTGSRERTTPTYDGRTADPNQSARGRRRYVVPAIRVAVGIMDVICTETGRCPENDFRRTETDGVLPLTAGPENRRPGTRSTRTGNAVNTGRRLVRRFLQ